MLFSTKKPDLRKEMERRKTTTGRLLAYLKKYGEIETAELMDHFGTGCSSRLHELRKEGHVIVANYVSPGNYRYVYLGQKESE